MSQQLELGIFSLNFITCLQFNIIREIILNSFFQLTMLFAVSENKKCAQFNGVFLRIFFHLHYFEVKLKCAERFQESF